MKGGYEKLAFFDQYLIYFKNNKTMQDTAIVIAEDE